MTEADAFNKLEAITNPESPDAEATAIAAAIEGQAIVLTIMTMRQSVRALTLDLAEAEAVSDGTPQDYNGELAESVQMISAGIESLMLDAARALARASAAEEGREFEPSDPGEADGCGHCFACLANRAEDGRRNN